MTDLEVSMDGIAAANITGCITVNEEINQRRKVKT